VFSAGEYAMRFNNKLVTGLMLLFLAVMPLHTASGASLQDDGYSAFPSLDISSYVLKDLTHCEILASKDTSRRLRPASLTKVLTSVIAIESGRLHEIVTIPAEAAGVEPTRAGFLEGEKIRLVDLVKAAMVKSSNDAAFAIAIHLGGSIEGFCRIMNRKAERIGMQHSHFTNPAGFDHRQYEGNYSTAADLLMLTEYAVGNEVFNSIARLESATIAEQQGGREYVLRTSNKLLKTYPYAVGIKTGYTSRAGKCLIARANRDGRDLVLVMLNAHIDRWSVAEELFEKAFSLPVSRQAPFTTHRNGSRVSRILIDTDLL
jgi:serine-type D-Ala-D-Ala carboxypeptidase (penicillin-binding protein 5/6)